MSTPAGFEPTTPRSNADCSSRRHASAAAVGDPPPNAAMASKMDDFNFAGTGKPNNTTRLSRSANPYRPSSHCVHDDASAAGAASSNADRRPRYAERPCTSASGISRSRENAAA